VAWTEGTRARWRAHRSMGSGHSRARKLAGGGTTERGELGLGLTRARAVARWPSDGGKRRRWSVLGGLVVADSGAPRPFVVAREGHAGARKGETTDGNGLNAIEGGAA
jgi:hypothetical protein